jgi:molybdenum cofactor cytidylyltransferase
MTLSSKSSPDATLRVAIILLAAGEGRRMGSIPKALLQKNGATFLQRFCVAVSHIRPVELIVVTGYHADQIEASMKGIEGVCKLPTQIVLNPQPERGQASSVRIGLEALHQDYDVVMMCLCDQPNVGVDELKLLLQQFQLRSKNQEIILPLVNGQRGNPVLFSRKVIDEILSIPKMVCRAFMDIHPQLIHIVETENQAFIQDVDTPADILGLNITQN